MVAFNGLPFYSWCIFYKGAKAKLLSPCSERELESPSCSPPSERLALRSKPSWLTGTLWIPIKARRRPLNSFRFPALSLSVTHTHTHSHTHTHTHTHNLFLLKDDSEWLWAPPPFRSLISAPQTPLCPEGCMSSWVSLRKARRLVAQRGSVYNTGW